MERFASRHDKHVGELACQFTGKLFEHEQLNIIAQSNTKNIPACEGANDTVDDFSVAAQHTFHKFKHLISAAAEALASLV
jgi:hypothetical protein